MSQINVLLVDDEEELIAAWVERMKLRGINATGVTNGNEAIQKIKDTDYNVVVLDIKMPGIDGFEIMQQIQMEKPRLPIILITGHQCTEEESKGMLSDAFDCLVKPVNIEILIERINEAVNI
jgi:DNA-binding NtrC family response regulator